MELVNGVNEIFDHVNDMATMDNYIARYREAVASTVELAQACQHRRVQPDLPIEIYEQMRLKVAREIQKLSEALDNP